MSRKIYIFGDSHSDAIKRALAKNLNDEFDVAVFRYASVKNGTQIGDKTPDEVAAIVASMQADDMVVSAVGGNQHQVVSLVQHPVPFDLYTADRGIAPDRMDSVAVIPHAQMLDYLITGLRGKDSRKLTRLVEMAACPVYHLSPPPPKEDAEHILKRFETAFREAGIQERGVSDARVRLKVWQAQIEALRALANEWRFTLLPNPAGSVTEEGFLARPFYANDATHGNAKYGELVVEQLKQVCRTRAVEGA